MDQLDEGIATEVTSNGATVYMTKSAIVALIGRLQRISEADPNELCDVHLGMLFSWFDQQRRHAPPVVFADDLWPAVHAFREAQLMSARESGELGQDIDLAPFEVTLTHAPPMVITALTRRAERIGPSLKTTLKHPTREDVLSTNVGQFDTHLLRHVTHDWRKMARIIGAAIGDLTPDEISTLKDGHDWPIDALFQGRLQQFIERGQIAYQGDTSKMGFCELRLHPKD